MHLFDRIIVCAAACLTSAVCSAAEPLPRSVLILDPFGGTLPWVAARNTAFRTALNAGRTVPFSVYEEYLDFNRFAAPHYKESLISHFREKYRGKPIGMTVAFGPLALDYAVGLRIELWPKAPVVFGEIAEGAISPSNLPAAVTGSTINFTLRELVAAARALLPDLSGIALVGDPLDQLPTHRHFKDEIPVVTRDLEFIDLTGLAMADLRKRVTALPDHTAIIYTAINFDGAGVSYIPAEALSLVAESANRPIVINTETYLGRGAVGGFLLTPASVGQDAARLASRIFDGEDPSTIAVTTNIVNKPIFDWRQLQRWGINVASLPPGSEIRFREPTAWEQYRWQILAIAVILALQATLIAVLLFERRRRRSAEAMARHRMTELAHMNRRATVSELSASIAHELNQPLGAILSNTETAELILQSSVPNMRDLQDILADIRRDDQRASEIIRRLRGLLGKTPLEVQQFDLNDVVREVVAILADHASVRKVAADSVLAPEPLWVNGDRIQLQQVVLNLVVNAMEAMSDDGRGPQRILTRTALSDNAVVECSIADSGPGIPPEKLKILFEPFFTTKEQGMGMGLSIARTIVEAHGGRLWAENQVGGGAVFRFDLPLAKADPA